VEVAILSVLRPPLQKGVSAVVQHLIIPPLPTLEGVSTAVLTPQLLHMALATVVILLKQSLPALLALLHPTVMRFQLRALLFQPPKVEFLLSKLPLAVGLVKRYHLNQVQEVAVVRVLTTLGDRQLLAAVVVVPLLVAAMRSVQCQPKGLEQGLVKVVAD
jgi:hypothetical protein